MLDLIILKCCSNFVIKPIRPNKITLQRHLSVLPIFTHVESRLSGRKQPREVVFYTLVNLCDRRLFSVSVAVGLSSPIPFARGGVSRSIASHAGRTKGPICPPHRATKASNGT